MSSRTRRALPYVAFVALALIWGFSFFFIKIGVADWSPSALVLLRASSGALALVVFTKIARVPLLGPEWRRRVLPFAIMAVINGLLPWTAIAWGEEHITSGLASILNATATLWTAILVFWIVPAERPSRVNYVGVLIGIAGVAVLVLPDIQKYGLSGSVAGIGAVILASFSYGVAAVFQRTRLRGMNLYQQSLGQMLALSVLAFPVAAPSLPRVHLALGSILAIVALGVFCTAIALLLYYYVMNALGAVRATAVTLVVPVTAVFWGALLLRETVTLPMIAGMVVILVGIVLTNLRRSPRRAAPAEREAETAAA